MYDMLQQGLDKQREMARAEQLLIVILKSSINVKPEQRDKDVLTPTGMIRCDSLLPAAYIESQSAIVCSDKTQYK